MLSLSHAVRELCTCHATTAVLAAVYPRVLWVGYVHQDTCATTPSTSLDHASQRDLFQAMYTLLGDLHTDELTQSVHFATVPCMFASWLKTRTTLELY